MQPPPLSLCAELLGTLQGPVLGPSNVGNAPFTPGKPHAVPSLGCCPSPGPGLTSGDSALHACPVPSPAAVCSAPFIWLSIWAEAWLSVCSGRLHPLGGTACSLLTLLLTDWPSLPAASPDPALGWEEPFGAASSSLGLWGQSQMLTPSASQWSPQRLQLGEDQSTELEVSRVASPLPLPSPCP